MFPSPEDAGGNASGRAGDQANEDLRVQRHRPGDWAPTRFALHVQEFQRFPSLENSEEGYSCPTECQGNALTGH
jgi:hypothetical protein